MEGFFGGCEFAEESASWKFWIFFFTTKGKKETMLGNIYFVPFVVKNFSAPIAPYHSTSSTEALSKPKWRLLDCDLRVVAFCP